MGGKSLIFVAGCGIFARAVRKSAFNAREWERLHGENFDLTRPIVLRRIEQDMARGKVLSALLAPPCGSFFVINRFFLRTRADPWAEHVVHGSEYMRHSCQVGNACMRAALRLIKSLERHRIPWILEHPRTARSWWLLELMKLLDKPHVELIYLDQ